MYYHQLVFQSHIFFIPYSLICSRHLLRVVIPQRPFPSSLTLLPFPTNLFPHSHVPPPSTTPALLFFISHSLMCSRHLLRVVIPQKPFPSSLTPLPSPTNLFPYNHVLPPSTSPVLYLFHSSSSHLLPASTRWHPSEPPPDTFSLLSVPTLCLHLNFCSLLLWSLACTLLFPC